MYSKCIEDEQNHQCISKEKLCIYFVIKTNAYF